MKIRMKDSMKNGMNVNALALVALGCGAALPPALAQSALAPPQAGFVLASDNSLRPLAGIAGNFLLGDPVASGVLSAAASTGFVFAKTPSAVFLLDAGGQILASVDSPDGDALFAFTPAGGPGFVFSTAANQLIQWRDDRFQPVAFDPAVLGGEALSISSPDSDRVEFIVRRDDGLWWVRFVISSGAVEAQAALPGVASPALRLATGEFVYSDAAGIRIRRPDGAETHLDVDLPPGAVFEPAAPGWLHLRTPAGAPRYAVRLAPGRERVFQIPEAQ